MEVSKLKRKMRIGEGDFFLSIYYTPGTIKDDLCASSYDIQQAYCQTDIRTPSLEKRSPAFPEGTLTHFASFA